MAALSPDKKRLTEHLSAFANQPGGGYLVFGVDSAGTPAGVDEKAVKKTMKRLDCLITRKVEEANQ